jgi:hypothetical protein
VFLGAGPCAKTNPYSLQRPCSAQVRVVSCSMVWTPRCGVRTAQHCPCHPIVTLPGFPAGVFRGRFCGRTKQREIFHKLFLRRLRAVAKTRARLCGEAGNFRCVGF